MSCEFLTLAKFSRWSLPIQKVHLDGTVIDGFQSR